MHDEQLPRVRALALGCVALAVTAAGAVVGDHRTLVLLAAALVLAGVSAWRWHGHGRTGIATSAAVASVLILLLLVEEVTDDVDTALLVTAVVALVAAFLLRERRLAVSGVLSFGVLVGRPLPDGEVFRHCLIAPDVAIAEPRLTGPLILAVVVLAVGTAMRWSGWLDRPTVGRAFEATGGIGLAVLLLAKGMELPGHPVLCGSGDPLDEGWMVAGVVFGAVAGLYGLAARDIVWEGIGLVSITALGAVGTWLTNDPWWALGCGALLVGSLATSEYLRVPWPEDPGWGVARPRPGDLLGRMERIEHDHHDERYAGEPPHEDQPQHEEVGP